MYYAIFKNEKTAVMVGTVTEVKHTKGDKGEFAVVTLENRTGDETVKVFFKNGDAKKLADRVKSAKVSEGAFLAVLCSIPENGAATGYDFKYRGIFKLKTEKDQEANVIIGKIFQPKTGNTSSGDPVFSCTIPVDEYDSEKKEEITKWISVSFFDGEKAKNATTMAKILHDGDTAAIRIGIIKEKTSGEKAYYNATGYRAEKPTYKKAE